MDELKIKSKFMRATVSKIISMIIKKKLGYNIDIQINEIIATVVDGKSHIHISLDAEMDSSDLKQMIKGTGLED